MNPLLEYFRLKYPGASLQGVLHIASLEAFLFAFALGGGPVAKARRTVL